MEGDSRPVDFLRIYVDSVCKYGNQSEPSISPDELRQIVKETCEKTAVDERFASSDPGFDVGFKEFLSDQVIEFVETMAKKVDHHWKKFRIVE